jgi:Spy/CpxP family protein refolding chaperone
MKKLIIVISLALAVQMLALAQPKHHERDFKRFEAEKVAYITEQLELSVEEAQAFWPIYNKVQKEQREGIRVIRGHRRALREAIKAGKSDDEIKPLLDAWLDAEKSFKKPMYEYRAEFVKVLGEAKTAKLYLAEEGFVNRALRQMAGRKPSSPKP